MVNKFTNIKERVMEIAEKQPMTKEKFFESIGMKSASFRGNAKNTGLNSKYIAKIIAKYPEVDLYWLVTGEDRNSHENRTQDPKEPYLNLNSSSKDKDRIIEILQDQIEDLRTDRDDLKELLKNALKK